MKPKSHPSFLPSPTPSPCPPPNKKKICPTSLANWHCCNYIQILLHTKATHITKKKKPPIFQVNYFLLEKKNTKHTHFLRSIFFVNLLETDRSLACDMKYPRPDSCCLSSISHFASTLKLYPSTIPNSS